VIWACWELANTTRAISRFKFLRDGAKTDSKVRPPNQRYRSWLNGVSIQPAATLATQSLGSRDSLDTDPEIYKMPSAFQKS
jgi:hypothetical protein